MASNEKSSSEEKEKDTGAIPKERKKSGKLEVGNTIKTKTETGTETNRENKQTAVIKTFHGHIYHIWILILILTRGF